MFCFSSTGADINVSADRVRSSLGCRVEAGSSSRVFFNININLFEHYLVPRGKTSILTCQTGQLPNLTSTFLRNTNTGTSSSAGTSVTTSLNKTVRRKTSQLKVKSSAKVGMCILIGNVSSTTIQCKKNQLKWRSPSKGIASQR